MNLKLYPLDRQKCSLRVASCKYQKKIYIVCLCHNLDGWTTDDLKYQWKKDDPVQITNDLHLPRFTLEKYVSDYCNIKTNTGNYKALPGKKVNKIISKHNFIRDLLN